MKGSEPDALREQWRGRALLGACQADVLLARSELLHARQRGAQLDVEPFRANLVAALEVYVAAIERSGAPLPQRVRAELELYRSLRHRK
jgi:hypothetical protein